MIEYELKSNLEGVICIIFQILTVITPNLRKNRKKLPQS